MKFTFHLLDVSVEIEATPEEVLAVTDVLTPASLAKAVLGSVGEVRKAKAAIQSVKENSLQS